jgi:hypothetical protein
MINDLIVISSLGEIYRLSNQQIIVRMARQEVEERRLRKKQSIWKERQEHIKKRMEQLRGA